jgi:hypothetical protein
LEKVRGRRSTLLHQEYCSAREVEDGRKMNVKTIRKRGGYREKVARSFHHLPPSTLS